MKRTWLLLVPVLSLACDGRGEPLAPTGPETAAQASAALDATDRYIVVFQTAVPDAPGLARQMVRQNGGTLHHAYQHALKGFAATLPAAAITALQRNPQVLQIVPDGIGILDSPVVQENATFGLDRIDQRHRQLDQKYHYSLTGEGVSIYLIDSGIRSTHVDFEGRAYRAVDFRNDGQDGNDCYGHGTHVAGTIIGKTWGVAKQARLYSLRAFSCTGSGFVADFIAAVDWITANHSKPAVVNMSLSTDATLASVPVFEDAIRSSIAAGITYAVAAGSAGVDACTRSPARMPEVMTIAASTSADTRSNVSNYGQCVDWFAPGAWIRSASHTSDTDSEEKRGTSFSTPHVTGAAALYLQSAPAANHATVRAALWEALTKNVVSDQLTANNHLLYTLGGWTTAPPPNQAPIASISSPASGSSFNEGSSVTLTGSASDPEDGTLSGASLAWSSSIQGSLGTGNSINVVLVAGTHTITLLATDSQGATGSASISVTILPPPNQAPSASISSPASGSSFNEGSSVTLTGSASDPEDGTLSGTSLAWSSSIQGSLGTGNSINVVLVVGTHTITLLATDSQGATGSASISVTIVAAQPELTAAFTFSCPASGSTCSFSDASTPSSAISVWQWTFGPPGATSTLKNPSYTFTAAGNYTVQLTVSNGGGESSSTSREVTCAVHKNGRLRCN